MIIDNYLLAFNGLAIIWLSFAIICIYLIVRNRSEQAHSWLLFLGLMFLLSPITLLIANQAYPLASSSMLINVIVTLIVYSFIGLYLHTLSLLNIHSGKLQLLFLLLGPLILLIPEQILSPALNQYSAILRTIAFHSSCIFLLILSIKNLQRLQKTFNFFQVHAVRYFLIAMTVLFSCRIFYGFLNPQYLTINPHEQVDFVFFLIRLLLIILSGLTLGFLISMQRFHLVRINPYARYTSTSEYDIDKAIQERNLLIDSLLRANKTLSVGAISTSLAHELNQPLSSIGLNLRYLKEYLGSNQPNRALDQTAIDDIEKAISRASRIIQTVSNLSSQASLTTETKRSSIRNVVYEILAITSHDLHSKNIEIDLNIKDCELKIGQTELEQVLLNLISNAVKALDQQTSSQKKWIRIQYIDGNEKSYVIEISNNGGVIEENLASNLFHFMKSNQGKGMGIGLWLTKYILDKNESSISYRSIGADITCFTLSFPKVTT